MLCARPCSRWETGGVSRPGPTNSQRVWGEPRWSPRWSSKSPAPCVPVTARSPPAWGSGMLKWGTGWTPGPARLSSGTPAAPPGRCASGHRDLGRQHWGAACAPGLLLGAPLLPSLPSVEFLGAPFPPPDGMCIRCGALCVRQQSGLRAPTTLSLGGLCLTCPG